MRALDYDVIELMRRIRDVATKRGLAMTIHETDLEVVDNVSGPTGITMRSISSISFEPIGD